MKNKMSNEEIKKETEEMYIRIKAANERLKELRSICRHEQTIECEYSWRIGASSPAKVCQYCGEFITFLQST